MKPLSFMLLFIHVVVILSYLAVQYGFGIARTNTDVEALTDPHQKPRSTLRSVPSPQLLFSHYLLGDERSEMKKHRSSSAFVSGLTADFWRRVYFRGNHTHCASSASSNTRVIPMFQNGYAAGPLIDCRADNLTRCRPEENLLKTHAMQSLASGRSIQFFLPQQDPDIHRNAIVIDRARMSSATGVVFLNRTNYMVVASFATKNVYLYKYDMARRQTYLLSSHRTAAEIDLVDYDAASSRIVVSHLFTGRQEVFHVDVAKKHFTLVKSTNAFGDLHQWCHEACFYPTLASQVLVASTTKFQEKKSLMIRLFDYQREQVLAEFLMSSTNATDGFVSKGIRMIDGKHMLTSLSSLTVEQFKPGCNPVAPILEPSAQGRLVLMRLNFDVKEILERTSMAPVKQSAASDNLFTVVDCFELGVSAVDGLAYDADRKLALVADQLNDCVLVFRVNVAENKPLQLITRLDGYIMPHGVALSSRHGLMAVTSYGDNSVFIQEVPKEWSE